MNEATKEFLEQAATTKKLIEQSDAMKKIVDNLDMEQRFRSSGMADAMKSFEFLNAVKGIPFPSAMSIEAMHIPKPPVLHKIPTLEESNNFQSAGVLLRRLADSIVQWRAQLLEEENIQPAVLAILHGGLQIEVETLAQESFHGIRIEGKIKGSPCIMLAHQATVQLLCFIQQVEPPERPRRPIGFVVDGEAWKV